MKSCLALMLLILLTTGLTTGQNSAASKPGHPLTMADLKFPYIDEDNGEQLLQVKTIKAIKKYHIFKVISEPLMRPAGTYSAGLQEGYREYRKINRGTFAQWYLRGRSDTSYYDSSGKWVRYLDPNIMTTYYTYTTNRYGMIRNEKGGSCVYSDISYLYFLSSSERKLMVKTRNHRREKGSAIVEHFLGQNYSNKSYLVYDFDENGYVIKRFEFNGDLVNGFVNIHKFYYSTDHKISSINHHYYTLPEADLLKTPGGYVTYSNTQYYYYDQAIDSVVTAMVYSRSHRLPAYRRTYFDVRGLPSKTVFENCYSRFGPNAIVYKYIDQDIVGEPEVVRILSM